MKSPSGNMRRKLSAAVLWLLALGWAGFSLFLSWQPGEDTGALSMELARFLLGLLARVGIYPDQAAFHMGLRLAAHLGVFFIDGLLAAAALAVSLPRAERRAWPYIMAALACSALAVAAEVGKQYVPGRHLQWDETLLNVAGSVLGVGLVVAVSALRRRQG